MHPEDLGGRLAELESMYRNGEAKSYVEIDAVLQELNSLSSVTRTEPSADQPASVAKIADLRQLYTTWYNEALEAERAAGRDQGSAAPGTDPASPS